MASNELVISFKANTNDAVSKVSGLHTTLGGLSSLATGALTVGLGAAVAGVAALGAGLAASVQAAMEAEEGQAALAAVLASTGGKAGVTADMANDLASSLQNMTRFEDDAILGAENLLLTFTNIGKDVFPQATETVLNMSQALGQDLSSSAVQLGKALNDPINGMTALSRVGVSFTDEQKEMIKQLQESGDLMGAQKIILGELATEFGGAAVAAGDTFAGKLDILNHKFGDILEQVGGAIIPILTTLADVLIDVLNSEVVQGFAQSIADLFGLFASGESDLAQFQTVLTNLFGPEMAAGILSMVATIQDLFGTLLDWITGTLAPALAESFGALGSLLSGDSAAMGGLREFIAGVQSAFQGLMDWLTGTLAPALAESFGVISEAALPTLQTFGEWIQTTLLPALQQLTAFLGPILGEAFRVLGTLVVETILPALTDLAVWIFKTGLPAFGDFANKVGGALNDAFREAGRLWGIVVKGFQDSVKFVEETKTKLEEISDTIMTTLKNAFEFFQSNIINPTVTALAGLKLKIQEVIDMVRNLIDAISKIPGGAADFLGGIIPDIPGVGGIPLPVGGGGGQIVGERFGAGVIPLGGGGFGERGGVTINLTYAPVVSLMDEAEAQMKLSPFVREAVRAAMGA